MVLEENRSSLVFEHREVIITIRHDFYGDEYSKLPYVDMVNLVSSIVMLYESIGVVEKESLRFNNITPISNDFFSNEPTLKKNL